MFYFCVCVHVCVQPTSAVVETYSSAATNLNPTRPPSEMSQYGGSSGYGSTRSNIGPHLAQLESDKKCGSLRNSRRFRSDWPQFRSLRTPNKRTMLPIKESPPESKITSDLPKETNNNQVHSTPTSVTPPVPAPRKMTTPSTRQCNTKHTYQNVPIPITPNSSSNTDNSINSTNIEITGMQVSKNYYIRGGGINKILFINRLLN